MSARSYVFTSESVTEGHPDKIADQISDSVLDAVLAEDPLGRVACETLVTTGLVMVAGEISTETYVDVPRLVRDRIAEIGYTHHELGLDAETCGVITSIQEQSPDIARGVDDAHDCEGDPLDMDRSRRPGDDVRLRLPRDAAADAAADHARACHLPPSGRGAEGRNAGLPAPRRQGDGHRALRAGRARAVSRRRDRPPARRQPARRRRRRPVADQAGHHRARAPPGPPDASSTTRLGWGRTGSCSSTPPASSSSAARRPTPGLTGRKIIVDSYGGAARQGGGCFSGKDPTKVDRSAAYATRYVAKNIVAAGLADRCELEVAYAIGVAHPVSVTVECFGTEAIPVDRIEALVSEHFDLRPAAIIRDLDLTRPIYAKTAAYGHFGRDDPDFTWERTDRADVLREAAGLAAATA